MNDASPSPEPGEGERPEGALHTLAEERGALRRGLAETGAFARLLVQIPALAGVERRIGASIIAEGIEAVEHRETLRELDIPYGQGHLLTREDRRR